VGDKVSYIPNIFTMQKMIFNASSVLGCFYKKFQPELVRPTARRPFRVRIISQHLQRVRTEFDEQ
jgi:hypothetical protein